MVRSNDPFWIHIEEMSDGCSKCKFCGRMFAVDTSISRIKWHLSGEKGHGVAICAKVPKDVQDSAYFANHGANKRSKIMPNVSNNEWTNASSSQQQQSTDSVNQASLIARILMDDWQTDLEMGENRDFSCAQAGNHIENITIEKQQLIQTGIHSERFPVDEHETSGGAIQPTDEVDLLVEKEWSEIYASLMDLDSNINETNERIATSLKGQNNPGENGAVEVEVQQEHQEMEVEIQQEHQPLPDIFWKMDLNVEATLWPLFEKLMSPDLLKFAQKEQVDTELEKCKRKLFQIHAVLNDAEEKQVTDLAVKNWLSNLRDLAYDAEDILDGFQTEALRSKLNRAESQASTSTTTECLPASCADPQRSSLKGNFGTQSKQLKNITTRLEQLVKDTNELSLQTNVGRRSSRANKKDPTTSLVREPKVYGREKVKEELVELLLGGDASNSAHSVIPIVGIGGVGKTTLAQLAYNDGRLMFDHKAWVCVSDEFDVTKITKTILLHLGSSEATDLNVLQQQLKDKLHGKKFFIVLDDIWQHKYNDWTTLCSPFALGAPGSKIIITTRCKDVSSRIGTTSSFELKELPYDECLCLFAQHAIDAENFNAHPDLKEVGQKIVERCKGLPLAAMTLGGLLRHKQHLQEWEEILNSEIWDLPEEESGILSALRLSYHHLPSHLKQCFAYCAIFPKDYEFHKDELVWLWMAEGFLRQPGKNQLEKDLGQKYFHDLLSRYFFQESNRNKSQYVMHDLISDLAQFVGGGICFRLDDKSHYVKSYENVRHSSFISCEYDISQRFEVFHKMKSLRTFVALQSCSAPASWYLSSKVLDDLIPKLKCLRALSLAHYKLKELPRSIGASKHLRYLNLSYTSIEKLPESLGELLNLQTLELCGCRELVELPACIGNLINLQCLDISGTDRLRKLPPGIGKLKNLVTLPKFIVGEDHSGLRIGDLKNLSHLRGQLHIIGLHDAMENREAKCFYLKEKQCLDELDLEWSDDFDNARNESLEYEVLNSLQPHQSLEKLSITAYSGAIFPLWLGDPSFTRLVDIELCNCRRITSLPGLGKLSSLRNLRLKSMNEVKEVVVEEFLSLETLTIEDMVRWEQWSWSHGLNEGATTKFPKLHELTLANCPRFVGNWSCCFPSLSKFEICSCPQVADLPKALPSLCELDVDDCQEVIFKSVHHFTSLTTLNICGISRLVSLHGRVMEALVALEDLGIYWCHELMYLWEDGSGLGKFANLKRLRVSFCDQLVLLAKGVCSTSGVLIALEDLSISDCRRLKCLWEDGNSFGKLANLKRLHVQNCVQLVSLVKGEEGLLPCNLQVLIIERCHKLEKLSNGLPTTLKELHIHECEKLEFQERIIFDFDGRDMPRHSDLQYLSVSDLSLTSFPAGFQFLTSLEKLEIHHCKRLKSLPSSLHTLYHLAKLSISYCDELELFAEAELSLPNLIDLDILECPKLRSLPNHMENLTALQELRIWRCDGIESFPERGFPPNLISLGIGICEQQPMSEWGLHKLTSLRSLSIIFSRGGGGMDYHFPDEDGLLLPTSLTYLWISSHKNLKSISRGLQHLTSLKQLFIWNCPNLKSLPKEGFPPTLGYLNIQSCPLLKKGDHWSIIAHIPLVHIPKGP